MNPIYTFLAYGALLGGLALATLLGTGELGGAAAVMLVMMRSLSYGQQVQTSIGALSGSVPYVDMLDETMEQYSAQRAPGGDRVIDEIGAIEVELGDASPTTRATTSCATSRSGSNRARSSA